MTQVYDDNVRLLRAMTKGAYDLQQLRIQTGLRLVANFRARLQPVKEGEEEDENAVAEKALNLIKASYRRLTDGIVSESGRINMRRMDFTGDPIISSFTEFALVQQYIELEQQESRQFRRLESTLELIPIYQNYLKNVKGIGPAMAAVLVTYLDVTKARHVSSFWKFAGLDVGPDGTGRSRRENHLIEHTYTDKNGKQQTRMGITFNPFLKTKLVGVIGPSFLRSNSPYRKAYDDYKHRVMSNPSKIKATVGEWKAAYEAAKKAETDMPDLWTPGRIHSASVRYMVKMFLQDFWVNWRTMEGLPVTQPYREAMLGLPPHGEEAAA